MKIPIKQYLLLTLSLILSLITLQSFSQTGQFDKVFFNGQESISISAMAQSENGNILLVGAVNKPSPSYLISGVLIQLSPDGTVEWLQVLESTGNVYNLHSIAVDDGWIVLASDYDTSFYVVKYSVEGNLLWQKGINFPVYFSPSAVGPTDDGGCIVIGSYDYFYGLSGQTKLFVARFGPSGDLLWSQTYSGDFSKSWGVAIRPAGDDQYMLAGYLSETTGVSPLLAKISGNGDAIWGKKYHSEGVTFGGLYDMISTEMGLALHTYQNGSWNGWDIVFCTDPEGEPLWAGQYEYLTTWEWTYYSLFSYIRPLLNTDYEGNLVASGNTFQSQFIHIGSEGEAIRANSYGMYGIGSLTSPEGNLIVIGNGPVIYVKGNQDFTNPHSGVSKLNPEGQSEMCMSYSTYSEFQTVQLETVPVELLHSPAGEVFDAMMESNELLLTVRDTCLSILGDISAHDAQSGERLVITPNPATTEVWLQLPANIPLTDMQIELYSPTGSLLYRAQPTSTYHKIETTQLPVGLYVVRLWDGSHWQSGRLVVR
ncbi:MAG: T9SS type A sorting domain-containing protein [Bacteroidales bacterium]|nr:T9SS type A sorting domain-containing protein [Bacteroidales bacterium]